MVYVGSLQFRLLHEVAFSMRYCVYQCKIADPSCENLPHIMIFITEDYQIFVGIKKSRRNSPDIYAVECLFDFDTFISELPDAYNTRWIGLDSRGRIADMDCPIDFAPENFPQLMRNPDILLTAGIERILWPFLRLPGNDMNIVNRYLNFCEVCTPEYPLDMAYLEQYLLPPEYSISLVGYSHKKQAPKNIL